MARSVKCHITGESGTSDIFVKIGRYYYKSKEIYDNHLKEKETRDKIVEFVMVNFIHYENNQPFPTFVYKKIKELDFYSNEVILETLKSLQKSLNWAMKNKDFSTEQQRINYIFAAVKNHINTVNKEVKAKKAQKTRIEAMEIEPEMFDNMSVQRTPKQKVKNISRLLDD
ncbi:hypothetical protein AALA22_13070 [Anaerovoracaceae bacterium 41-7]